ncbi:MAG TPA: hypothetical protein VFO85_13260 [Vicinamibacteria bacterium]|nr:hypothetical protein [Vicinamibacteria bacterium]
MTLALAVLLAAQTFANAIVVSTDTVHHKLTFTRNGGPSEELTVDNAARTRLAELKPGDEVILTLRGDVGLPMVVAGIERSARGTRPRTRFRPSGTRVSPTPPAPSPSPVASPRRTTASPSPGPSPTGPRPKTDTVGPLQDPRKGAQQDPRDNPARDPRVVPGLTEPPSPVPSPTPTPTPQG